MTARPHIDQPVANTAPQEKALVICGDRRVFLLTAPPTGVDAKVSAGQVERLSADAARVVLESCWSSGTPPAEAARIATRSTSYAKKVFARLADGNRPGSSPLELVLYLPASNGVSN
ncbi:hypothetical protein ACFQ7B_41530 [Streptomyces erythrochromogenes]|uniref:hypothetical protein n=1 Tax=Streptomyces erythrochromogenes TaxID=285574 RepID=UPI0036B3C650